MERDQALEAAVSQIERQFGKGAIMKMGDHAPSASTSSQRGRCRSTWPWGLGDCPAAAS